MTLPDGAKVVVVGGGPAGSFFAIRALRQARELGRTLEVTIFERKTEVCFCQPLAFCSWEGCNYCAGGISPRLADVLKANNLDLPEEVIESRATEVTVHGEWKSIRLPVPEGREMLTVFRGSRPKQRPGRYANFDSFLLHRAVEEGAQMVTAEVCDIRRSPSGRPVVTYQLATEETDREIEVDFAAIAAGINRTPGMSLSADPLFQAVAKVMPGLRPPKVRRAVISEMQGAENLLETMEGEVHFAQYGSKDLSIEMSSFVPKGKWITVVLLGKSIDRADPSEYLRILESFVALPHIRRVFPRGVRLRAACTCRPNMAVGAARSLFGDRVALVGDMAVSRLYKDGLYSAYITGFALADCVLTEGIDRQSLKRCYAPVVKRFDVDNRYGRVVFLLSRVVFSRQVLSRIVYQALLTERKTKRKQDRRLAAVLWRIASGDDSYGRILRAMMRPASMWSILTGGLLATIRNYATERVFGLVWEGFGRYPTGVAIETVRSKRQELLTVMGIPTPKRPPQVEKMYSILIRAETSTILRQLGQFGEPGMEYFTPRFVRVHRVVGTPDGVGKRIRYDVTPSWLSFDLVLEKFAQGRYVLYRVTDGFARGGILAFDVDCVKARVCALTIYVAFNFPHGTSVWGRLGWRAARLIFPAYIHDVLWNHSLCRMKHLAELDEGREGAPPAKQVVGMKPEVAAECAVGRHSGTVA
jgi:flavin-dependent dehydrogenase